MEWPTCYHGSLISLIITDLTELRRNERLAKEADIIGTPTLVKVLPAPLRRLIGDLSDDQRVLRGLDIKAKS